MTFFPRLITTNIKQTLARGKSILLLGPRQTGKTTLIEHEIKPDITYSFAQLTTKQRYEQNPALLEKELEEKINDFPSPPLVFIDEVQKIPAIMDSVQYLIDKKLAQFILSGSSARKLKHGHAVNLLPGRVTAMAMHPLLYQEISPFLTPKIEEILLYGTLPNIITEQKSTDKESDLYSYVTTYLEEEIRAEALVRNMGSFSRFLEVAAGESGKQINFTRMSQDIGVADTTLANYYQILEDCLIVLRIDPIIKSTTKRRLIKSPKYLFFDLGVRRACANEGIRLPQKTLGDLFEHYAGIELLYSSQLISPHIKIRYWRDSAGPEIDYVLEIENQYVPIEVKWTDAPDEHDARHLKKFMDEYPNSAVGYIICRTPQRYKVMDNIIAIPWQEISTILTNF